MSPDDPGESQQPRADMRNGAWLQSATFEPVNFIIPGVMPEGLSLLVGPPKLGKSWLVLATAIARASGGVVLGQRVATGPVLYLALEDGWRRLQSRCRVLLADGEQIPAALDFIVRLHPEVAPTRVIADWLAQHRDENPLVIVDTFGKIKPAARAGGDAYQHDYRVMTALKHLVDDEPGSGMVLVHHDRKAGSDDFLDRVSGTHGIAGAADTTIVIARARTQGEATISVTGRDVTEAEYAARFTSGRWDIDGATLAEARQQISTRRATENLGQDATRLVEYVSAHPEGIRAKQAAEALDIREDVTRTYLARLVDSGRIEKQQRGLYTPVTSVTSVTSPESFITDAISESPSVTSISAGQSTEVTHITDITLPTYRHPSPACGHPLDDVAQIEPPAHPSPACGHPPYNTERCPECIAVILNNAQEATP